MRSGAIVLLLTVLVAGCGTSGQTGPEAAAADAAALATHLPPNYRQLIAQALRKTGFYVGIKDAEISNPVPTAAKLFDDGNVTVCVRFRDRIKPDWAYPANPTTELFTLYKGTVNPTPANKRMEAAWYFCGQDRTYTPFPEANKEYSGTDFQPFPEINKE